VTLFQKVKSAVAWLITHEPALVFAVVAAAVGLANGRWGLHLDAAAVVTWIGTALGVGVVTRQTVVSPATHNKRVSKAKHAGYLAGRAATRPPEPPHV
jgi:hypothetical protein